WYRLISCGFVHFGVIHVGFNMLLLYQLGRLIEPVIGPLRFGLLYFAALLGGSLGALLLSPDAATGGASGKCVARAWSRATCRRCGERDR
ncbi:MAG: rhomboid family intramembrane serine protease, partial [Actinomycetota bacterium]